MLSKILRAGGTELLNIKTLSYHESVNSGVDLRPGCVASAYIEVVVYGVQSEAPTAGEALEYYRVDDNGNETYIGTFYAEPSIKSRNTYSFTAFDAADKLNVDFSARLLAIQSNFPMTLAALATEACNVAGVVLASTAFPLANTQVEAFYADNITCRDVMSYIAELSCRFVRCNASEELEFGWYLANATQRIAPTSGVNGEETLIAYKQNGLNYQNYTVANVGCVAVRPLNTENAAYVYPTNASMDNALVISGNLLLTNASSATMNAVAQHIYTEMLTVPAFRPARVELFPMESPFRAGEIVNVTDIQGVSFYMPLMSQDFSQMAAVFEATGNESYDYEYESNTSKALRNLANSIVQIDRLKVGYAEIDEAVIDSLKANGINADWINVGKMSVGRIDFNDYTSGINIPDVNDPSTLLPGQSISDGWIISTSGLLISGDASNVRGKLFVTFETDVPTQGYNLITSASSQSWNAPAFGLVSSDGTLTGGTYQYDGNGNCYYTQTIDTRAAGAEYFSLYGSTKFRNVRVFEDASNSFALGFETNISIGSNGLQVGKFIIDRTGHVTSNGNMTMTGDLTVNGKINQVGTLNGLETSAKTDLVSAVNEVNSEVKGTSATYTVNGLNFNFYKVGRLVFVDAYGVPAAAIPTNDWVAGSATVAAKFRPGSTVRPTIMAATAGGAAYAMQVIVTAQGVFRIGYAAPQIPTSVVVRCEFLYVAAT